MAGGLNSSPGVGAMIGPTLGASIWRMKHAKALPRIEAKEKEFYQHIVRNRVDPSAGGSANNPVPDFYGLSCPF
jgi:mitochondrial import inner membrane translocase subunit TIM23